MRGSAAPRRRLCAPVFARGMLRRRRAGFGELMVAGLGFGELMAPGSWLATVSGTAPRRMQALRAARRRRAELRYESTWFVKPPGIVNTESRQSCGAEIASAEALHASDRAESRGKRKVAVPCRAACDPSSTKKHFHLHIFLYVFVSRRKLPATPRRKNAAPRSRELPRGIRTIGRRACAARRASLSQSRRLGVTPATSCSVEKKESFH